MAKLVGPALEATGLVSGWGKGFAALPGDAHAAAKGRSVISAGRPTLSGDRFRRATRECLLAIAAVGEMLENSEMPTDVLAGERTALLYATASAYGASNRAFIEGTGASTLHFPYTAPSAVPAEVAIEFRITGPYVNFIGGAPATLSAVWYAAKLLASRECDRVLVLAVETFEECEDLYARGRWCVDRPLVEAAACVLLTPGEGDLWYSEGRRSTKTVAPFISRRLGESFSCSPLVELGLARASGVAPLDLTLTGAWRGSEATLRWIVTPPVRC
jgi:hypothetical protein